ncbi:hypothetical protein ACSBR2_009771 [Camellia fascicularis]
MGSTHNKLHHCLAISFLFLLISSSTHLRLIAEGRAISRQVGHYQEEKTILRGQIGSKPPQCERRCSSCGHCEAIQVPTNPQIKTGTGSKSSFSSIDYARGGDDDSSNYKPMSWKCKCGNSLFNP